LNLAFSVLFGTGILAFRKKLRRAGLLMCLLALTLPVASCGGGGSSGGYGSGGGSSGSTATQSGLYVLYFNASTGGVQDSLVLNLYVQ
jgi:hypothetical protein